jgi:hypothetical protein
MGGKAIGNTEDLAGQDEAQAGIACAESGRGQSAHSVKGGQRKQELVEPEANHQQH